ncbi:MAG: cadmium-translocating P-type ATPase [Clostridia bacterium]|nr:cadmium-translocating P-type ATPase [Clostridia bacterium]
MTISHKLLRKEVSILKNYKYTLEGLDCANCAKKIEDKIAKTEGYEDVNVNFSTLKLTFKTNKQDPKKEITEIVSKIEPEVNILESNENKKEVHSNKDIFRIIIGLIIFSVTLIFNFNELTKNIITIIAFIILLYKTAKRAVKQITKNRVLDENTLIVISAIGAYLIGKTSEGLMVITLYEIGKILEARAINKTRKSISELMNIKPEYANLKQGEEYKKVAPEEVKIEDIIIVKSGEKIPLDGEIIKGNAEIDTSTLTGESKLQNVKEGKKVLSGSINVNGLIEIKVENTYENSTVSQILNLVENATDKKAKTETFVSKAAKIYTPVVMVLAILVAIFMPLVIQNITYQESIYKALVFLVISCPCSIAISVPLSYFSGIGKASKKGILVKGSDYLDGIKDIKEIIFDKTGTITTGKFIVSEINSFDKNYSKDDILKYFAKGEKFSNHPIAKSILDKFNKEFKGKDLDTKDVTNFEEISGKGLQYVIGDKNIKIGNSNFVETESENKIGTVLYLSINGEIKGNIILSDEIKAKTKETISKLNKLGINTKMFTGDKKEIAIKIGEEVGIKSVKYEMLPQDKYNELEKIINNREGNRKVAFVGDGINDSPVLARADIGISMGGIGSSSAIETSDVVIMTDELDKIVEGIQISKKTNKIIIQNLIFAIGVKILTLILNLFGIADMWQAVFADVGTTLITIFNTLRILK